MKDIQTDRHRQTSRQTDGRAGRDRDRQTERKSINCISVAALKIVFAVLPLMYTLRVPGTISKQATVTTTK